MSSSSLGLVAANAALFLFAFIGVASADLDALIPMGFVAMLLSIVNGVAVYRRQEREPKARSAADEMDARTVLDIDARLEALERREREMEEAERIRQMVARGQMSPPAEPLAEAATASPVRDRA